MRAGWLVVLAVAAGCLDPSTHHCADGSVCAPGFRCAVIADTTMCVRPDQVTACEGLADGMRCVTNEVLSGTCTSGVCIGTGCANGITDEGEACDDGNLVSGDGCSADCRSTEICGNGIIDRDEECDCGTDPDPNDADPGPMNPACPSQNSDASGLCSLDCHLRCGDGVVSADEGCDPAAAATVSCAGAQFDRGVTDCSASCQPVISADTCRYIGFRTRTVQPGNGMSGYVRDLIAVTESSGFFIADNRANTYANYVMNGNPYVANVGLLAIWAADGSNAITVGQMGKVVHYVGTSWGAKSSGTTVDLRDVWGRSATDAYAIGDSTVLRWNGTSWSSLAPPTGNYRAVVGDATHLYVVGDLGKVAIYDGTQWTTEDPGTTVDLTGVWTAGGRVVAVGAAGTIVSRDASGTWTPGRTAATANLRAVWGSVTDGFFAVGERGTVLFDDGTVWRPLALGRGVMGSPSQTFFAVGGIEGIVLGVIGINDIVTYEGAAWSPTIQPTSETLYGLWGSSPDDIYAVGRNGTILHHDGLTWTEQTSPTAADLRAISGTATNDIYAAGDGHSLLRYNGSQWSFTAGGGQGTFTSLWATQGQVFLAGTNGLYRYDGTAMTRMVLNTARAIWGSSASDVWAAGGTMLHYNGANWNLTVPMSDVTTLVGTAANDIYAIGKSSQHYDGSTWTSGPFHDDRLVAACTTADKHVFAVGRQGTLRYWGGTTVEPFVSRTTADLSAVFMTGRVLVMAGADGTLDTMVFHR